HSSGLDHAPPALGRRAARGRRDARNDQALRRARNAGRYTLGSGPGLGEIAAMMRYAEVPWPWAGLTIALVLLAQESLLKLFGESPSLALTSWRILVMTIGVTSLALILLPPRRPAYLLGALSWGALRRTGWARSRAPR